MHSKTIWVDGAAPAINPANLNKMEQGIFDAFWQSSMPPMEGLTQTLTYTGNDLTKVTETLASTGKLFRQQDLTYVSGSLSTVRTRIFSYLDGTTLLKDFTDTLNYTSGNLTSTVRTVTL